MVELTFDNPTSAQGFIAEFEQWMKAPAVLAEGLQKLLKQSEQDKLHLVVTYAGGSALAQSNLVAAKTDWETFGPGKDIVYAAIGAVGESDAALQIGRLATFETAVAADSREVKGAVRDTLIPYPEAAMPDDADGVMLLVTVKPPAAVVKTDLVTLGHPSTAVTHVVPYFQKGSPTASVTFQDSQPQGTTLASFIATASPAGLRFAAVTLWSTTAAIDPGAAARAVAVRDAVAKANLMDAAAPTQVQVLTPQLLAQLAAIGLSLAGIDDVIAIEFPNQPQ